ncbi:MAG: VanZ family protein [Thiohalobacteraceae bacterium]
MSNRVTFSQSLNPSTKLRWLSLALALGWMATLFVLSSQSTPELDLGFSGQDKLLHLGAYGLLGLFCIGALPRHADGGYSLRQVALAAAVAALYGLSDEWHQSFVPGRSADLLDLVADAAGGLLGALLGQLLSRRRL